MSKEAEANYRSSAKTEMDRKAISLMMFVVANACTTTRKSMETMEGDEIPYGEVLSVCEVMELAAEIYDTCVRMLDEFKKDDPSKAKAVSTYIAKNIIDHSSRGIKPEEN